MRASKRTDAKVTLFNRRPSGDDLKSADGRWRPEVLKNVEKQLREHGAARDFEHLIDLGCQRDHLLDALVLIGPYANIEDSQSALIGFKPRKLRTVLKRMRACADEVELLLSLGHTESLLSGGPKSPIEDHLPYTPLMLRLYADYVEGVMHDTSLRPRSHFSRNLGISHLILIVKRVTRRFCDREVSALLSAVLDRQGFDEQTLRQWRSDHRDLILPAEKYYAGMQVQSEFEKNSM